MKQIAILVGAQGRGSNMRAIAEACARGELDARVCVVVSPREDAPSVDTARSLGLHVEVIPSKDELYTARLLSALECADLVCLAGYMRLLPVEVLERFPGRVLNIHPALLPKFGGKGMYGHHVHEAVLAAGDAESGCTVHYVTPIYDEGEIIVQLRCPVKRDDTPETLAGRVLKLEHEAYPEAIRKVLALSG